MYFRDYTMRQAMLPPRRAPGYRLGAALILTVILQLGSVLALAQKSGLEEGGLDYYAPRTGRNEIDLFNNVQGHHLNPGREKLAKGQYYYALQDVEFILRYYPNHPQALNLLSELCLKWKSPACHADQWFQKALERNPDAAPTYVVYGIYLQRKKQLDEAVKAYQRAIELDPGSVNAHYNLALAYIDLKQYDLANQHAQKSYELGVSLPGLRSRLEKLGKWDPGSRLPASEAKPAGEPSPQAEKTPN